jgi:hypothetical protein
MVALHWEVRGARVCIECHKQNAFMLNMHERQTIVIALATLALKSKATMRAECRRLARKLGAETYYDECIAVRTNDGG